jgi:WS/DGAT/MGAT family acyltransferase
VHRLTGLDAAFLAIETPSAHMQILGTAVVDPAGAPPGSFYERIHALMDARIHLIPPLRRRLVEVPFGFYTPVWIEDPDFDLDYHLRRAALPAPGGPAELAEFIADVAGRPLDRAHPLWEAYVVEGLEHGHIAFIAKLHHSLIDGASGVEVIAALFDLDPNAPLLADDAPPDTWEPERVPGEAELLVESLGELIQQPAKVYRAFRNLVPNVMRAVRRTRDEELDVALPLTAPRLSMNRSIGPRRSVALSSVSLDEVKAVKSALGVTVNDVVLAITAGAMRTYLERRDELPDRPLVASIPTSVRASDDRGYGNRVSSMFAALPVEQPDPLDRLDAVARSMSGAKGFHEEVGGNTLQEWAELAAPALFGRAMRFYTRLRIGERLRPIINLVMSNVPGPPFPLYFAGAQVVAIHPMGPIFDDCGLNVTVLSYLDHIDFGFLASRDLVPDVDRLAAAVPEALAELKKAAGV